MLDLKLSGKTAIVTGGSEGIGLACAKALFSEGVNVVIVLLENSPSNLLVWLSPEPAEAALGAEEPFEQIAPEPATHFEQAPPMEEPEALEIAGSQPPETAPEALPSEEVEIDAQ